MLLQASLLNCFYRTLLQRAIFCTKMSSTSSTTRRVPIEELQLNVTKALQNLGHRHQDAKIIAEQILYAEIRANNQGVIKVITGGLPCNPNSSDITIDFESPVSAKVNGGQRIGMTVVAHAVDLAIKKAKETGIAVVGCANYCSATGALGSWARKLTQEGMIGIVMSQCPEMVCPHGSYEAIFGTNPLAIGVPTLPRAQILDMATSACAWYGLKTAEKEGASIPDDVAYDKDGNPTTDPSEALKGALRVFDRSFKGSHLALMVELLAGALTGADMEDKANNGSWGSLVIAIHPRVMGPENDFQERAMTMCNRVKNAKLLPGFKEVTLPGERGDAVEQENLRLGTIPIPEGVYAELLELAAAPSSNEGEAVV